MDSRIIKGTKNTDRPVHVNMEEQPTDIGSSGRCSHQCLVSSAPPRSEKADKAFNSLGLLQSGILVNVSMNIGHNWATELINEYKNLKYNIKIGIMVILIISTLVILQY